MAMQDGRTDPFDNEQRDSRDETRHQDREAIHRKSRRSRDRKERSQKRREKELYLSSPDRKQRPQKRRKNKHESSDSDSSDREERTQKRREKKHQSPDVDSAISASSSSLSAYMSSSGDSNAGERPKRERKRTERRRTSACSVENEKSEEKFSKSKRSRKSRRIDKDRDMEQESGVEKKRRLVKEAKKLLKRHKEQEESNSREFTASGRKAEKISADDYFLKSSEFATWLKEDRGVYFSDLTSKETHQVFEAFVDKWNGGRLQPKYYDGIQLAPRTSHNWAIKRGPEDSSIVEEEYASARKRDKYEKKKFQKEYEVQLDEILPKATGREAQMEKKAIRREQRRSREESPPELMKEKDIMGGGDDFQQRLAREKARRERKHSEKIAAYIEKSSMVEEKEIATMEQFRALVNVAGGKITMAKRQ